MTDQINQKRLDSFPPLTNSDQHPQRHELVRRHNSKPYVERSDFLDAIHPNPLVNGVSSDDPDTLDTPLPKEDQQNPKRRLIRSRRASDSVILVSDYQMPLNRPGEIRRRRRESSDLFAEDSKNSSLGNEMGMTFPNHQKPKFTIFNSSSPYKGSDSPKNPQIRRKSKPRVIHVDEFDDAPKLRSPSGSDESDPNKDSIREWESTPRKTDIHRQHRNPIDIGIE